VPNGSRMRIDGTTQYSGKGNQGGEIHCRTTNITAVLSQYALVAPPSLSDTYWELSLTLVQS
jgi:hypothetical protein